MFKYLGKENDLFKVEDTDDGAVDKIDGDSLRQAMNQVKIEGLYFDDNGNICEDMFDEILVENIVKTKTKNSNLTKAKKAKNDEFYTQLSDIEKELSHYPIETFKDKVIYCPMDVAVNTGAILQSQFVKYFQLNAHKLQFKKLICTCLVEKAQGVGEDIEDVQNCYVIERKTVHAGQRKIHSFVSGKGGGQFASDDLTIVGEVSDLGLNYITGDGTRYPVPEHIINQIVTNAEGKQVLVCKPEDWTLELDTKNGKRKFELHKKWYYYTIGCDDAEREVDKASYFFNNDDFWNDLSILPQGYLFADRYNLSNNIEDNKEYAVPCFEDVEGGSVCLYPAEYYDYKEIEYVDYFSHCPEDDSEFGGSGDFRSEYCTKLLQEADIVVTNPPFSLFREFVKWLVDADKEFIIVGNVNCVTYKEIFPLIKDNKLMWGFSTNGSNRYFEVPEYYPLTEKTGKVENGKKYAFVNGVMWYSTITSSKRDKLVCLSMQDLIDKGVEFLKYDNYDAIDVSKVKNIPMDYDGVMGVPITFLNYYNPDQFEIVGISGSLAEPFRDENGKLCSGRFYLNGKRMYDRIVIRHRKDENGRLI